VKLKRIDLQGFKSFVDRTGLEFASGVTAILGPNGCGKSNIVDAVRWVLGEQSPRTLRGDCMEDVIFKGTTKRKPVGLAEVTLIFTNEDRRLPIEFDEVAIRRKVTRDGGSEYFLNGTLCRLKDLRDLFYDSGAGNASYSIIEHAMINVVLNEHTQELRRLIEEGSGITKYKARRKETQRKLDRTQQDLLRLNDLIEEIGKEVRSLRYQVGKARRHQRLTNQIRALDLLVAGRQHQDFAREEKGLREKLAELKTAAEANTGELAELRAEIETTRPALDEREAERRRLEESLQAFTEQLQESERNVLVLEHRIGEHERRLEQGGEGIEEANRREGEIKAQATQIEEHRARVVVELEETKQALRQRREDLSLLEERLRENRRSLEQATQLNLEFVETDAAQQSRLRELEVKQENRRERQETLAGEVTRIADDGQAAREDLSRQEEARARLVARRQELLEKLAGLERQEGNLEATAPGLQESVARLVAEREAASSRLELLRRIKDEYQGYRQGARQLLQDFADDGRVLGSLADQIQIREGYTAPFETLLAELLDAIVVDAAGTAVDLVAELRRREVGQASFLSRSAGEATDTAAPALPPGGRPALELVSGVAAEIPFVKKLLAATVVFASDEEAVGAALAHEGPVPLVCLSETGLLVTNEGVVRGGRGQAEEVSLLGRGEMLDRLSNQVAGLERRIVAEQERQEANRTSREQVRQELISGRGELSLLEEDLGRLHGEVAELKSRSAAAEKRLAEIEREQATLAAELTQLADEAAASQRELERSGQERSTSTSRRDELQQAVVSLEAERDQAREEVEQLRLVQQGLEGQGREGEATLAHLRENLAELAAQRERLGQEIDLARNERESLTAELTERKAELSQGISERERRQQLVRAAADAIGALHEKTAAWHDRIKEIEEDRARCREAIYEVETELATLDIKRRNLTDRLEEQYHGTFAELVAGYEPEHLPKDLERDGEVFQLDQALELLAVFREKFSHLGPINQLALEEYETKNERLVFLEKQRDDVVKARDDLTTAINRINRTARKLFSDTFEDVRRNYIAVFQTLFEGGRADLELIRTDDPLESNIHIVAQPRGKVVNHVGLLSGGERCLTALSLLFAVYLVKPSPFCMLDEIDAPLDDSNIQRFVRMLREFSKNTQFLVVTHNKLTMETANHLYGVTMMEEGVSSIVSVTFSDVAETQSDAELGQAISRRRREVDRRETVKAILADDEQETAMRFTLAGGAIGGEENAAAGESGLRLGLADEEADEETDGPTATESLKEMEAEQ